MHYAFSISSFFICLLAIDKLNKVMQIKLGGISELKVESELSLYIFLKARLCLVSSVERDLVMLSCVMLLTIHVALKQTPAHQNLFSLFSLVTDRRAHRFSCHIPFQGSLWLGDR
jgi:hypothetical protein